MAKKRVEPYKGMILRNVVKAWRNDATYDFLDYHVVLSVNIRDDGRRNGIHVLHISFKRDHAQNDRMTLNYMKFSQLSSTSSFYTSCGSGCSVITGDEDIMFRDMVRRYVNDVLDAGRETAQREE